MDERHALARIPYPAAFVAPERPRLTLKQLLGLLRQYALTVAVVFVLTVVGAYAALSLMTEQYDTDAQLLVKMGRENLDPPAVSRNVPFSAGLRHEELMSEIEILRSPDLLAKVVDQVGVDRFNRHRVPAATFFGQIKDAVKSVARGIKETYSDTLIALDLKKRLDPREKAIAGLMDGLAVEPVKDSDVISLKLRMPDAALARDLESALIQNYLVRRVEVRRTPGVQEFLDQLATDRQRTLTTAEARTEGWKKQSGITSPVEETNLLLKQIRDLSGAEATTSGEINAAIGEIAGSEKILGSVPEYQRSAEQQTPNPARQSIEEKLISLKLQRSQELQKYRSDSGSIESIDQSIARLTDLLQQEKATQVGSVTVQLNPSRMAAQQSLHQNMVRLEGLRAMDARQKLELSQLTAQLSHLQSADSRLVDMERSRKIAEQDYDSVVRHKLDSDLSTELDKQRVSNVSVARVPSSTLEPVYPRKLLIMAIALAGGLILGIGLALLLHYFDDRVQYPEQLELETGLPHLGTMDVVQPA